MEYTIEPSIDGTYIIVSIDGDITGSIVMKTILEAHALGRKLHVNRFLMDVTRARNTDSALGNYSFAYSDIMNISDIDKSAYVATLISPEDHSHDFAETVLRNAGFEFQLFTEKDRAIDYLKTNSISAE